MSELPPNLAIGSETWPGLAKLSEECGELIQVIGKLTAYPQGPHPDGTDLQAWLADELADVQAAAQFVVEVNLCLPARDISRRSMDKLRRFRRWHREAQRELSL